MIGWIGAGLDNSMLREQLLAALVRSQCAIADLLDHTAQLRRSFPQPDEELSGQQRSAAVKLEEWLAQAMGAALARDVREDRQSPARDVHAGARRSRKRPASPWLAECVYRGNG